MNKILLLLLVVLSLQLSAQTSLPYYTGFDNATEKAGWVQFRQGFLSNYNWGYGSGFSAPTSISHDYPVGSTSTDTTIDWFVSPSFDFSNGGMIDSLKVRIFSITGNVTAIDYLGAYLLVGSNNPSLATSKIELGNFTGLIHNNGNWNDTGKFVIPASTSNCYIGIKYRATNNWFVVNIDNIYISATNSSGFSSTTNSSILNLFPNPAKQQITIADSKLRNIEVMNTAGQIVPCNVKSNNNTNKTIIDIQHLTTGIYYLKATTDKGLQHTTKFIKE